METENTNTINPEIEVEAENALMPITDNMPVTSNNFDEVFGGNIIAEAYSGDMSTEAGRAAYYKCITDCDARVSEMINRVIMVRDIYSAKVNARNTETGEIIVLTRGVLIDTDGCAYTCSSAGVVNSLNAIFRMFGEPTWENGLPLMVKQKTLKNGNSILTLVYCPNGK